MRLRLFYAPFLPVKWPMFRLFLMPNKKYKGQTRMNTGFYKKIKKILKKVLTSYMPSDIFIYVAAAATKHRKCSTGADSRLHEP